MRNLQDTLAIRAIATGAATILVWMSYTIDISIAGSNSVPENPWHQITNFELDEDHGYLVRSPFDDLNAPQLAAIPKGQRIHYNAPSKCVPNRLKSALKSVAAKYGPIT
ncbi:MAG: hypothetical protein AAF870_05595, partial [Pseudomonadota bacterium]